MASYIVIFGCGNPLRTDDGLGRYAIEQMRAEGLPDNVELHSVPHLVPELAAPASLADLLIFVDAGQEGQEGEVRVRRIEPGGTFPSPSHRLAPAAFLTLLREVYGVEPEAYLVTLRGQSFELGEGLSTSVPGRIPELLQTIAHLIASNGGCVGPSMGKVSPKSASA